MSKNVIVLTIVKRIDTPRLRHIDESRVLGAKLGILPEVPTPHAYQDQSDLESVDQKLAILIKALVGEQLVVDKRQVHETKHE